jgi:hypothetical protein
MGLPAFDTHAYVKRLKLVGFSEQQAEAQAELNSQILSDLVTEKLATKEDITNLKISTKNEIEHLRTEFLGKIENLRTEFLGKFNLLYWMLGFMLAGIASIVFKLF